MDKSKVNTINSKSPKPCIISAHLLLISAKPQTVHPAVGVSETEKKFIKN